MATDEYDGGDAAERATPPLGQRLYDNWPLLMILGIAIMALVFTGWGLWDIITMPAAELP